MEKEFKCCLCNKKVVGYGNNPDGAAWRTEDGEVEFFKANSEDRCCDECNSKFVIPGRLYQMRMSRGN